MSASCNSPFKAPKSFKVLYEQNGGTVTEIDWGHAIKINRDYVTMVQGRRIRFEGYWFYFRKEDAMRAAENQAREKWGDKEIYFMCNAERVARRKGRTAWEAYRKKHKLPSLKKFLGH